MNSELGGRMSERLFPMALPSNQWVEFRAAGFSHPVCGVIYRLARVPTCGMPLGGIDTGCIDLETSGLWGYCSIFNTLVPRRGPLNIPFLGLSVGGQTWVLCDPTKTKDYYYEPGAGDPSRPVEPVLKELRLEGVRTAREIHYWGHYPVADLEYEIDAPVEVGLRAWTPFLPGDIHHSMIPGIILEVHLRNPGDSVQQGTIAFSFPGPTLNEAGWQRFDRRRMQGGLAGVSIGMSRANYVVGVIGREKVRLGAGLDADPVAWAQIAQKLPEAPEHPFPDSCAGEHSFPGGTSAAVDFTLQPRASRVVRFVLAWHSPQFKGGGHPTAAAGNTFTHMYATRYHSAEAVAQFLAAEHESLLRRVLAWQEVMYSDKTVPGWLQDSLINVLHLIAEDGMWAVAVPPVPEWVRPEDGLFGMNESPRTCPQIECIPCSFYGNSPLVYFFPELALSTLRGHKGYQAPDGNMVWIFGGTAARIDFSEPQYGPQITLNGLCYTSMVDCYALCWGDEQFAREFYEPVKKSANFVMNLRPQYDLGDRVISMPDPSHNKPSMSIHWFEATAPGWYGLVAHVGGLHLAQLRLAQRMAEQVGDKEFIDQCRRWIAAGSDALETKLWDGSHYLLCWEVETGRKSDLVFAYQLDGEWVAEFHGLKGSFRPERVKTALETIKRCNVALSRSGATNYAHPDGRSWVPEGEDKGYGTHSYFTSELLMLAMTYMYKGEREFGLELARRCWENIVCRWGYAWDMPCFFRGDRDTGERSGGLDYGQDLMLWSLPAAIAGEPFHGPLKPGGLVERVLRAAKEG